VRSGFASSPEATKLSSLLCFHFPAATVPFGSRNRPAWRLQSRQPRPYRRLVAYSFLRLSEGKQSVSIETRCRWHTRPGWAMDTLPRPERLKNPTDHRPRWSPGGSRLWARAAQAACGFRCSSSKRAPFFQTIKVIAAIFARQRETSHRRLHPLGEQTLVKLVQGSCPSRSRDAMSRQNHRGQPRSINNELCSFLNKSRTSPYMG